MFNGLMKSKFHSKCKSDIKLTNNRIEIIKKRRNAMQKYLRNDIADLLRNGLDINAYGRAEGLVIELTRTSCYEFIYQCCEDISKNLSTMDKQRECPDECKEAVASLMFASARFADLPELRHLRSIFSERYGNALDYYVNKQFAEKLKSSVPSKDMKIQLLQEIAAESGFEWDSKALENELYQKMFSKKTDGNEYSSNNTPDNSIQKKDCEGIEKESQNVREFDHRARSNTIPPISDIQMDIIGGTKRITEASLRNEKEEEHKDNTKPLHYKSIPPPYTKLETNKPNYADAPKSVRTTKPLKSPPGSSESENEKEKSKNKEKEKAASQGQRILKFFDRGSDDREDEEEKTMDKLLKYYSRRKGGSHKKGEEEAGPTGSRIREAPGRLSSLPVESMSPKETPKKHTRAASFQPDNGHVHPKLPDYDDFVARLAELRGKRTE